MNKVILRNTGTIPLAIPKCPRIEPNSVGEVPAELFERFKNNPSVKNWLGSGRLVIIEGAEAPVETPKPPPAGDAGKSGDGDDGPVLSDEQIEDILSGSASDALDALSGADAPSIARAIELEGNGKARKGLTADLQELLEPDA